MIVWKNKKKISTVVVNSPRLFKNPGKALTVTGKCPKNDKTPHDCDCPPQYRFSQQKWSRMYTIMGFVHVNLIINFLIFW